MMDAVDQVLVQIIHTVAYDLGFPADLLKYLWNTERLGMYISLSLTEEFVAEIVWVSVLTLLA